MASHLTLTDLRRGLDHIRDARRPAGPSRRSSEVIVVRPAVDEREVLDEAGWTRGRAPSDNWSRRPSSGTADGSRTPTCSSTS
jgi:hypothetical protein